MTHYFSAKQTSLFKQKVIKAQLRGKEFDFTTASGTFSISKVDTGSELLANKCILKDNWEVLDLGCGYGPIGIAIAAATKAKVTMTDINERAIKLAKLNAESNHVSAEILQGNLYEPVKDRKFDAILVNPPYVAGRRLCFQIIEDAKEHLKENGLLQVVARHQKGGKTLEKRMKEVFGNVKSIAKGSGYRIYVSVSKN